MSGLVDRITAVLRQHYAVPHGAHYWRCAYPCDWKYGEQEDHAVHVAERVVEATRPDVDEMAEAMADADDGIIFGLLTPDEAEFYRRMARAALRVSGWSAVEEKP